MNNVPYTTATDLLEEYSPKQEKKKVKDRDEAIYVLAQTSGWSELKKIIDSYIESLEPSVKEGDTVESVGYKYLATLTAKSYLQSVIDTVEQTFEVVENERQKAEQQDR
jgi:hypothetical protein